MSATRRLLLAVLCGVFLAAALTFPADAQSAPTPVTVTGLDLHDGTVLKSGSTYYMYGTEYACGFQWGNGPTTWCGFGVSTASSLTGPWSSPTQLFSPNDVSPYNGMTWQALCGGTGQGCFNPRMIVRTGWGPDDGVPILWFNAPRDYSINHANAYYAMGCNALTGPCGAAAGAPHGTTIKPAMTSCTGNGDFSIVPDDPRPPMVLCTMVNQTLSSERLTMWGTGGVGGQSNLAGVTSTETPGGYQDSSGTWLMTYSDVNCGYCAGTGTSYARATAVDGAWFAPGNVGFGAPATGRRMISATSCGGQPRTVFTVDGQPWEWIDLWTGARNETAAGIHLEPLAWHGEAPFGLPLQPFTPWGCY